MNIIFCVHRWFCQALCVVCKNMLLLLLSMPLVKTVRVYVTCVAQPCHMVPVRFLFCGTSSFLSSGLQNSLENAPGTVLFFWLAFQGLSFVLYVPISSFTSD